MEARSQYKLISVGSDYPNPYWIAPNGQAFAYLHRVIAEQALGRFLEFGEEVHHIDLDPANNAAANLRVCSKSEHRRIHKYGLATVDSPALALV